MDQVQPTCPLMLRDSIEGPCVPSRAEKGRGMTISLAVDSTPERVAGSAGLEDGPPQASEIGIRCPGV